MPFCARCAWSALRWGVSRGNMCQVELFTEAMGGSMMCGLVICVM